MTAKERIKELWTATGVRWSYGSNKLLHEYHRPNGEVVHYSRPVGTSKRGRDIVGGVYEVSTDGDTVYGIGNAKYQRTIDDDHKRTLWRTKSTAAEGEAAEHRKVKKAKRSNPMHDALDPIREAYREASHVGRRAILADVLAYVTGYGR